MKFSTTSRCLLLALVLPLAAAAAEKPAVYRSDVDLTRAVARVRIIGLPRAELWSLLGEPSMRLTSDIWIYWDCRSTSATDNASGKDTLVVAFMANRVWEAKFAEHQVVINAINRSATPPLLAAK